jgi:hemerythrin-like metal-binding protein
MEAVLRDRLGAAEDRLLDELVRLSGDNFSTEEDWMRRCGYEHSEVHAESHAHLLRELVELRDGLFNRHEHVNRKAVAFVRRWLESHLAESDRQLARAVRQHLLEEAGKALSAA